MFNIENKQNDISITSKIIVKNYAPSFLRLRYSDAFASTEETKPLLSPFDQNTQPGSKIKIN